MPEKDQRAEIREKLARLEQEKTELLARLNSLDLPEMPSAGTLGCTVREKFISSRDASNDKISLFIDLFVGRKDVYAKYWSNPRKKTSGYSPACSNEWRSGVCNKPRMKCLECPVRSFMPLDNEAIRKHLEGHHIIGTYAILKNDGCRFLAVDFDGSGWEEETRAYVEAGLEIGVEIAIERSRSGNGGHAWIFFSEEVSAREARHLGSLILNNAMNRRAWMKLESYDRFFPNQDFLPKGGFGNLIALPMQKTARTNGNTLFIDLAGLPFPDQWEYLSRRHRLSAADLIKVLEKNGIQKLQTQSVDEDIAVAEQFIKRSSNEMSAEKSNTAVSVCLSNAVTLPIVGLSPKIFSELKKTSMFANPKFFELQRMRFSTWKTPRYVSCGEINGDVLMLPRGCLDKVISILAEAGVKVHLSDQRTEFPISDFVFLGALTGNQAVAFNEIRKYDIGMLVAPPGSGKTVMACSLITIRKQKTLILTHRKQLVDQWNLQINRFVSIGKSKHAIDIKMIQTLARRGIAENENKYGFVIIDECHHIPALSFEAVLKAFRAKYILGLTATPFRKDGLHPIIQMQCGPIRHEITETHIALIKKTVIVNETRFKMDETVPTAPIYQIWEAMVNSDDRNAQIAADVCRAIKENRFPLVLSDRKDHIDHLLKAIPTGSEGSEVKGFCLIGGMGKKNRRNVLDEITRCRNENIPMFLIATGSFIGEGFDLPELDTLFLTMPIAFKGRIIQYVGRIHRESTGKHEVIVYDYLDILLPLAISMFRKRITAYRKLGYEFDVSRLSKPERWIR